MSSAKINSKRRFPRAQFPCKVAILDNHSREVFNTHTENIGKSGICVILPRELAQFCLVEILLYLKDRKPPVSSQGRIVWVAKKDNIFDTGIEFIKIDKVDSLRIQRTVVECLRKQE